MDEHALTDRASYGEAALSVTAEYTSPQANRYLDLLLAMDQLLMRIDALWLSGLVEAKQRMAAPVDQAREPRPGSRRSGASVSSQARGQGRTESRRRRRRRGARRVANQSRLPKLGRPSPPSRTSMFEST